MVDVDAGTGAGQSTLSALDPVRRSGSQGLIYNKPFFAPGFGFEDVAQLAREAVAGQHGAVSENFLFNAIPHDLDLAPLYP